MLLKQLQDAALSRYEGTPRKEWDGSALYDEDGKPHPWEKLEAYGDTLAVFIVLELHGTYDPEASDWDQRMEAGKVLQRGVDQLQQAADAI